MAAESAVAAALAHVTGALASAEERPGQQQMAALVEQSLATGQHLVVQAGTGTGKTLGYLVPVLMAGKKAIVATATKALQDQLAAKDLPFLAEHLGRPFEWAVLKGRSNYICMQRVREIQKADATAQLELEEFAATTKQEISRLTKWSATTRSGDMAELKWSPSDRAWQAVSVSGDECPGATRCPLGGVCFAEGARNRANAADVTVVNLHLYGLDVAAGGVILPEHEVVIVDEAHQLEDIMSDTVGVELSPYRFTRLGATLRKILDDPDVVAPVLETATSLRSLLMPVTGQRLSVPLPDDVHDLLVGIRLKLDGVQAALRAISTDVDDAQQRVMRAKSLCTRVQEHLDIAIGKLDGYVPFVSGTPESPRLEIAPLDIAPVLARALWAKRTGILCSATIPSSIISRVGLTEARTTVADVGSPFDYGTNALLYCARHLPSPKSPQHAPAMHEELAALINAAGGRTLALFTSWKAMDAAAEAVRAAVGTPVLTQRDMPKTALVKAFSDDEAASLFATAGFFQGVDIPGQTLSLVTIDRIPFPRPDDPLLSARRELLGPTAFAEIDLPRASMLLAQATGRLIRSAADRGVVAVFDSRLSTARYGWDIVRALPPMRRTRHRADAEAFLRAITAITATTP
jgi:ATP-dependent DNA helicase DinG